MKPDETGRDWLPRNNQENPVSSYLSKSLGGPFWLNLAGILFLGLLAVASASHSGYSTHGVAFKQVVNMLVGLGLFFAVSVVSPKNLRKTAWPFYVASLILLILVMVPGVGQTANGSQRWISLGPFGSLQPSELVKLAMIFLLSELYAPAPKQKSDEEKSEPSSGGLPLSRFIWGGVLTAIPFLIVAKQPDLGTALVIGAIYMGMSLLAGIPNWFFLSIVGAAGAVIPHVLKPYQKDRLMIFMHPEHDPQGLGYQIMQSRTAIGSGGFWGQGYLQGPLTQNGFVPENWTDFIFTVFGEESGMMGCLGLGMLISIFCAQMFYRTWTCEDRYLAVARGGVLVMLGFQWVVNLFMTVGLAPVVGIPLPFCSYGGSAMFVNLTALGLFRRESK